ncbi:hypothetical protein AZA_90326 [Nitrospirillum viridazoti Y2]|nr:hypothetical protein AZA_90326 [Nitrospirillum amazonense Y2]
MAMVPGAMELGPMGPGPMVLRSVWPTTSTALATLLTTPPSANRIADPAEERVVPPGANSASSGRAATRRSPAWMTRTAAKAGSLESWRSITRPR